MRSLKAAGTSIRQSGFRYTQGNYDFGGLTSLLNSNKRPGEFYLNLTANTPTVPCPVLLRSLRTTLLSRKSGVLGNEASTFIDKSAAGGGMNLDQRNAPLSEMSRMSASYSIPLKVNRQPRCACTRETALRFCTGRLWVDINLFPHKSHGGFSFVNPMAF